MKGDKSYVYAIVRLDKFLDASVEERIAVQAVLPSIDEAQAEEARLNGLRDPERVIYFVRPTRFYPEGRKE